MALSYIRALIRNNYGTITAMARDIGISQSYLSDVLRGAREPAAIMRRMGWQQTQAWRRAERKIEEVEHG